MNEERKDKEKLPNGWKWTSLGEITKKISIKVLPIDYPDAKFIGMDCIQPHTLKPLFTYKFSEFKSSGNYFKVGQVLYGRMRPYLNKVYRAEYDGTCSGEFIVLHCQEEFHPDLLKYILHSREFVSFTNQKTSGDRPRISYEEISEYPIALAPLRVQEAIISKIEELLSDLDNGKQQLLLAQQQLKVYRQSLLKWAFEGRLTNKDVREGELPKGWKWKELKEITSVLGDGLHGTPKYDENGEYHFINGNNLIKGRIEIKNSTKRVGLDEFKKYKKPLNDRTVFVSINGSLGYTAFYNNEKIILGKSACYFNLIDTIDKHYIRYYLTSNKFINYANNNATGSTIKNVGLKAMRDFKIPIPLNLEEQQLIVEELESKLTVCDKIAETISKSLEQAETLRQSILKKAFEGKLI